VSVEGPGRLFVFAREHRAGFPPRLCGLHRCAHVVVLKDNEEGYLGQRPSATSQEMVAFESAP